MKRLPTALLMMSVGSAVSAQTCGAYAGDVTDYVALHSYTYPAAEMVAERIAAIEDPFEALVQFKAYGDFAQMGIVDLVLPMVALSCNYEMYDANACSGTFFLPSNVESVLLAGESLRFATRDPETDVAMYVVHQNRSFDRSVVTMAGVVSTWSRSADGTETFLSFAENGDETHYTERADCSGKGHVIRHNEAGLLTTNHFSWSAATVDSMTFRYKLCRHQEPDPGCHEGQI
jgi:hypothetical protein